MDPLQYPPDLTLTRKRNSSPPIDLGTDAHPLAHFMSSDHDSDGGQPIVPTQLPTVLHSTLLLSFPRPVSKTIVDEKDEDAPAVSIRLAVDASPGCGGVAWPAGQVLATYLASTRRMRGQSVLELGSGTGLVGLVAAVLGASVCITDQAMLLDIMHENVTLNALEGAVTVAELNWGEPLPTTLSAKYTSPDVILAADCVYFEPAFPLLVHTLVLLTSDARTEVLFCYKKRRKADKRFFTLLKKQFTWTEACLAIPSSAYYSLSTTDYRPPRPGSVHAR
ncbi:hypothetical protein PLICRDRAFT_170534 [Plicaturopsis crispa FD-325 SS-3]|nr:hypothetical protein PLICRDRAFT_170534 [Plicaturopsis crispa FD-325 SS-3]